MFVMRWSVRRVRASRTLVKSRRTRPFQSEMMIRGGGIFWCCWRWILISVAALHLSIASELAPEIASANALIARVLPDDADRFYCELIPSDAGRDVFEYEAGPAATVILRGNSSGSLAVAFNQCLRREALRDYDWLAVEPLKSRGSLPAPSAKIHRVCSTHERFFLNYCTYGYTMPWWDWAQWERFLDWMAMNGINRPLLQAGQEAVWLHVWQAYGLTADEVRGYFSGPAHLPWHRMGNLDRWGGPLPISYIEGQAELQKKIVARARALGMRAILPAFAGHVPSELARQQPGAKIVALRAGWSGMSGDYATHFLDPKDPLFAEIQGRFLAEQTRLYGTDHLYSADPFNEMDPPSWEADYLASVGRAIYRGMSTADPEARWYQMTWTFTYEKLKGRWTSERLGAMLHSVPSGRMVLLDYAGEEQEFYSATKGAFGLPFIWNFLGNFGGNTHLFAPLQKCATLADRALSTPNCVGVGATLEGIGVNPVIYEMLLEEPWEPDHAVDLRDWVLRYADRRAETIDPAVRSAWTDLNRDVFRDNIRRTGTYGSALQRMPHITTWKGRSQNPHQDYAPEALNAALRKLFAASPAAEQADGYRFDVVNLTRQALCNLADGIADRLESAATARDLARFRREAEIFVALGRDLDGLLGTRREFLLGPWVELARSWGTTSAEKDYHESNAREILTSWHTPGGELTDYASRQWNGLVRDYYLPRWEKWIALQEKAMGDGTSFPERDYLTWVNKRCDEWIHSHETRYSTQPQGDPVETAQRLFEKYLVASLTLGAPH